MTLTAIAIDDEPHALEVVRFHASKVSFLELKNTFTDAFEAIPYLQKNKIDLIFLDIKMPDISGIDFVHTLPQVPLIIFTTAYSEYAVKGFELDAIDYLLKPFSLPRFLKACNKALEIKQFRESEVLPQEEVFVFLKTGYQDEKVLLSDILYVEAEGNYMAFVLKDRKLLTRQSFQDVLNTLPESRFVRIHRSYIIAIDKVDKIGRQQVWLANQEIPFGASYEEKITELRKKLKL